MVCLRISVLLAQYYQNAIILSSSEAKFAWQRGYGIFSLGRKQLNDAIAYVKNQKQHHLQGTIIAALERETEEDNGSKLGDRNI